MVQSFSIDELAQVARPTLFDTASRPELLISLLYANLMSPSLWDIMRKIQHRMNESKHKSETDHITAFMEEIHNYVDKKFCHLSPFEVVENVGSVNIEDERKRISGTAVDDSINAILHVLHSFEKSGILTPKQNIIAMINHGEFPEYDYSIIDIIEALGSDFYCKHRPLGVTICADEATLIASLAIAGGYVEPMDVVILGSPVHYTLFLDHACECFWFNGKHEYHDSSSWKKLIKDFSANRCSHKDDTCDTMHPSMTNIGNTHWVRCPKLEDF